MKVKTGFIMLGLLALFISGPWSLANANKLDQGKIDSLMDAVNVDTSRLIIYLVQDSIWRQWEVVESLYLGLTDSITVNQDSTPSDTIEIFWMRPTGAMRLDSTWVEDNSRFDQPGLHTLELRYCLHLEWVPITERVVVGRFYVKDWTAFGSWQMERVYQKAGEEE